MTLRILSCFWALLVLVSFSTAALAETEGKSFKPTPITEWVSAENKLIKALPYENRKVFFVMRNKHSVMRSIDIVHRDIKNAVKACGKENKDLKKPMRDRLKQWEKAVFPIKKDAKKFLEKELKEQEAFHVSDYRHVMKLNDKAYKFSESKIEKTPVTTKEACESLLNSMDRTEDTLVSLLQEILLPEDVVRQRVEKANKK